MGKCDQCGGGCGGCQGCDRSLLLTEAELKTLARFAALPFLPVLRKPSEELPVDPEDGSEFTSKVLVCLEKKGLIDIDYHEKLKGFDYSPFAGFLHGSMALTQRGQEVLDALDFTGAGEE
jgi:hypothetical protein